MSNWTKPATFAGAFYPANPKELSETFRRFDEDADVDLLTPGGRVVGIVSPHAGYVFSGETAAGSFRYARQEKPDTVVAIGLAHRVPLEGVSILEAANCETPLGEIPCDREFQNKLSEELEFATFNREAHLSEHSVETQLPFIRSYFPEAMLVEILTQDSAPPIPRLLGEAIAEVTSDLGRRVLVVSSTDLSHYPAAQLAERIDAISLEAVSDLDAGRAADRIREVEEEGLPEVRCAVCSKAAVFSGMTASRIIGANEGVILGYAHSGQVRGGDRDRVVGYGSVAWVRKPANKSAE